MAKGVDNEKLHLLVLDCTQILFDNIQKNIVQYNAEEELWNHTVQMDLADSIGNKIQLLLQLNDWLEENA